jgi:hypothetical protein
MVSKTRSYRNSGFWYGFFPVRRFSLTLFLSAFGSLCIKVRASSNRVRAARVTAGRNTLPPVYNKMTANWLGLLIQTRANPAPSLALRWCDEWP